MPHDVFISYSSHDKAIADATCAALEAQRIRCWIAPRDVLAGTEYGEGILNAIEDCRAMVLVFSAHANESPHIRREVERAVSKGKFIVPFRIENVLPSRALEYCLGNTHWLDALTPPLEKRIDELVGSVGRLLNRGAGTENPQDVKKPEIAVKPTTREARDSGKSPPSFFKRVLQESLGKKVTIRFHLRARPSSYDMQSGTVEQIDQNSFAIRRDGKLRHFSLEETVLEAVFIDEPD